MAKATGLSAQYCSLIRRGLTVPHPWHWEHFKRAKTCLNGRVETMTELIRLDDIEEFQSVRRMSRFAINDQVLAGIRSLNETTQIEPFLRTILPDPTETAHGSTEIADILTTHVTYGGRARHAAFVNKGKSTKKVTTRNVGSQLLELRQMTGLDLMVLLAVGDIQDDIKRDLMQLAHDAGSDYMLVDAIDIARLFGAYQKVCPQDGIPFADGVCPQCGKSADEPLKLTIDVFEKPIYEHLSLSDVSTGVAKRYSADILTDHHYHRGILREVIKEAIWELRRSDYYRSAFTESHFGQQEAVCVFLFVYGDRRDKQVHNRICRAQWINPELPEEFRPMSWTGQGRLGDIVIDWNDSYDSMRTLFERSTKQEWIRKVEAILPEVHDLVIAASTAFDARRDGKISDDDFEQMMTAWESTALALSRGAENEKVPPVECNDASQAFLQLATTAHNIFVPFASWGRVKRDWRYKEWHLRTYLADYQTQLQSFQHEWQKVR